MIDLEIVSAPKDQATLSLLTSMATPAPTQGRGELLRPLPWAQLLPVLSGYSCPGVCGQIDSASEDQENLSLLTSLY